MKISTLVPVLLLLAPIGCGDDQAPDEAAALFERIQSDNYRSFATAPGYDTPQASSAPHSDNTQVFINDVVADVLELGEPITEWPLGSLIVKDGFDSDGELDLIAVMEKRADGWFWAEYLDLPSSDSKYSGKPDICINCHSAGDDLVLAFSFPSGG